MNIQPIKFACDALPDCQGQIVESIGNFVIIEGLAQDSGAWFAKGVGGARRFQTRQEAADYIEYAQDASLEETEAQIVKEFKAGKLTPKEARTKLRSFGLSEMRAQQLIEG